MIGGPKRRKNKYNPYRLVNIDGKAYIINFKDIENNEHNIEVSKEIFEEFNNFELKDISEMNEFDRHIEHSQLSEHTLNKRILKKEFYPEDVVIKKIQYEELHAALLRLPEKQYQRITMYFFKELNQKEIAKREKCSIRAIQYSIRIALKNLKKYMDETS